MKSYTIQELAAELNIQIGTFVMKRNILFEHLRDLKILQDTPNKNVPYIEFINHGFFEVVIVKKHNKFYQRTQVTSVGLNWFQNSIRSKIIKAEKKHWEKYYSKYLYLFNNL